MHRLHPITAETGAFLHEILIHDLQWLLPVQHAHLKLADTDTRLYAWASLLYPTWGIKHMGTAKMWYG